MRKKKTTARMDRKTKTLYCDTEQTSYLYNNHISLNSQVFFLFLWFFSLYSLFFTCLSSKLLLYWKYGKFYCTAGTKFCLKKVYDKGLRLDVFSLGDKRNSCFIHCNEWTPPPSYFWHTIRLYRFDSRRACARVVSVGEYQKLVACSRNYDVFCIFTSPSFTM